ncbi:C5a anaphylatoxin chemotactic receptor 1 [Chanos chanos]|uniref:C5a anaphylatoxin chemotactic receptor 1 n=1 Tax=Chanos chanos TaxID=29144 RepID=A0A6J2UPR0_CHACN|nr:C5a anaphylatoxin chemotactic receptor 1-like [Chanos chanos]
MQDDFLLSNDTDFECDEGLDCENILNEKTPVISHRHWISLVCYGLVFLLGVPGNGLVVWVTGFRMPRSVNALWFLNLALADLLCCLSLPLLMVPLAQDLHWPFGWLACKLVTGTLYLVMYCSVLLLVLISVDRWLLVSQPIWCQNHRQVKQARWVCLGTWMLALLAAIPHFAYMQEEKRGNKTQCRAIHHSLTSAWATVIVRFLLGFCIPFGIISVSHWTVYQRAGQGPGRQNNKSARMLRVILAVVLSFFLCWLPLHIVDIVMLVVRTPSDVAAANLNLAHVLVLCLAYVNSCLNPLLYVCLGRGFKASLTQTLRSVLHFASEDHSRGMSMATKTKNLTDNSLQTEENSVRTNSMNTIVEPTNYNPQP